MSRSYHAELILQFRVRHVPCTVSYLLCSVRLLSFCVGFGPCRVGFDSCRARLGSHQLRFGSLQFQRFGYSSFRVRLQLATRIGSGYCRARFGYCCVGFVSCRIWFGCCCAIFDSCRQGSVPATHSSVLVV